MLLRLASSQLVRWAGAATALILSGRQRCISAQGAQTCEHAV